jgi:maltose O-acetyltransferase
MNVMIKKILVIINEKKRARYIRNLVARGLTLGRQVHIVDTFFFDPSHCFLISIGDNCTICPNVRLIAHDASTKNAMGYTKIAKIEIRENCFIGDSVTVLPGVTIGSNSIIGAGSVVTRSIPENSVAAGNPARVITTTEAYLAKIETIRDGKKVFDATYYIEHNDGEKRSEVIAALNNRMGFIV